MSDARSDDECPEPPIPLYQRMQATNMLERTSTAVSSAEATALAQSIKLPQRLPRRSSREEVTVALTNNLPNITPDGDASGTEEGNAFKQQSVRDGTFASAQSRSAKERDKKSMLSQALQRANSAVALDNAQEYSDAIAAYEEACDFLSRVMGKTSNEEDRRKLRAIRSTYLTRVGELNDINMGSRTPRITTDGPAHRRSFTPSERHRPTWNTTDDMHSSLAGLSNHPSQEHHFADNMADSDGSLSYKNTSIVPGHSFTSATVRGFRQNSVKQGTEFHGDVSWEHNLPEHGRFRSRMAVADLGSSDQRSSFYPQSRPSHNTSCTQNMEAQLDTALNVAVEAAYVEEHNARRENLSDFDESNCENGRDRDPRTLLINLPLHGYNSFAEREAAILAARAKPPSYGFNVDEDNNAALARCSDAEEEERMLEDVTRAFMLDNHTFDEQAKSALPRHPDFVESWDTRLDQGLITYEEASHLQDAAPASKSLPPARNFPPMTAPPTAALPKIPDRPEGPSFTAIQNASVQDRRSSGHRVKRLQIRTAAGPKSSSQPNLDTSHSQHDLRTLTTPPPLTSVIPTSDSFSSETSRSIASVDTVTQDDESDYAPADSYPSEKFRGQGADISMKLMVPGYWNGATKDADGGSCPNDSPSTLLEPDENQPVATRRSDSDPWTLPSFALPHHLSKRNQSLRLRSPPRSLFEIAPVSLSVTGQMLRDTMATTSVANTFPYDESDHPADTLTGVLQKQAIEPPPALEPCPTSSLLRPFWLLRCFYQTLCHPRGGYITTRLFVPREVWKTKSVRLKCIEDKIGACELLMPVLIKLDMLNTVDSEAVLEEMQKLESVMDEVQANLSKKLGNDVGVTSATALLKETHQLTGVTTSFDVNDSSLVGLSADTIGLAGLSGSFGKNPAKTSYLSSWRRLRSRNSITSLSTSFSSVKDAQIEIPTLSTLPIASMETSDRKRRLSRRQELSGFPPGTQEQFKAFGFNAGYVLSLARLCQAAQILDDIARQTEEVSQPKSSPTQVALELSARRASEFFAFFVCKFVLQDLSLLIERFVGRASEWINL